MFVSRVARQHINGWNERVLNEDDAHKFCKEKQLSIVYDNEQAFGQLIRHDRRMFVVINPVLDLPTRVWVLWHEIGHFLLHDFLIANFSLSLQRKSDVEANFVAAVALIPQYIIQTMTIGEIQEYFGYPRSLIEIRHRIGKLQGL